ncbi:MAG: HAMP domain-containing histidine kinase [Chitinophagaceae bacterium]|nr:HAMP domain-containing histidine kinase [Chitinophagaceae bacterium]
MIRKYINWKTFLVLLAVSIAATSLYYANHLTKRLAIEERKKVVLIAEAIKSVVSSTDNIPDNVVFMLINDNTTIPLMITDANEFILSHNNIDTQKIDHVNVYLKEKLVEMKKQHQPIEINISPVQKQFVFYGESELLTKLRYFPYILLIILFLFIIIVVSYISTSNRQLQDRVWVGMSKETAHQLGTPLTSLVAWIEHLKSTQSDVNVLDEMQKDVDRLKLIADRFSKIGSTPKLEEEHLMEHLDGIISYMQKRAPKSIHFKVTSNKEDILVVICGPLFDWVIENLIRNSLDAMEGKGQISIHITDEITQTLIDISDTGKGIAPINIKKVFKPGFSTKKRGWGLGLSLAKRIISEYHYGDIFVKKSELGKGTTFRIVLKR